MRYVIILLFCDKMVDPHPPPKRIARYMNGPLLHTFIRSLIEYCSVVWHSRLTVSQTADLERVQKICLKVILSETYVSYEAALEMTGLEALDSRREARCLSFAKKCIKHPKHKAMFPLNPPKSKEKFVVNFARTETYRQSAIPYIQRMLNREYK